MLTPGSPGDPRAEREQVARIARGAPEVFFRVCRSTGSAGATFHSLQYVSRGGQIAIEDDRGRRLMSGAAQRDLSNSWALQSVLRPENKGVIVVAAHLVFGAPGVENAAAVHEGFRAFAARRWSVGRDYVFAFHPDSLNPHVHALVRYHARNGAPLRFTLADFGRVRTEFADALRGCGLDVAASRRPERAIIRRSESIRFRKAREAAEAGRGPPLRIIPGLVRTAEDYASRGPAALHPRERRAIEDRALTLERYSSLAARLSQSDAPADRKLAADLAEFVRNLPPAETFRMVLHRALSAPERETPERTR